MLKGKMIEMQGNWLISTTTVVYFTKNGLLASQPWDDFWEGVARHCFCPQLPETPVMPLFGS